MYSTVLALYSAGVCTAAQAAGKEKTTLSCYSLQLI